MEYDDNEVETLPPEVTPILRVVGSAPIEKREPADLKAIQDELFQTSLEVGMDMMRFREVDVTREHPEEDPIFKEWCLQFGKKKALRMYRIARAAWLPKKDAPVGLTEATSMAVGIMKARAVEKGGTRVLNVGTVNMYAEIPALPEKEVE